MSERTTVSEALTRASSPRELARVLLDAASTTGTLNGLRRVATFVAGALVSLHEAAKHAEPPLNHDYGKHAWDAYRRQMQSEGHQMPSCTWAGVAAGEKAAWAAAASAAIAEWERA